MKTLTFKHPLQLLIENTSELEVRSYSGRGMYGKKCLAVDCKLSTLAALVIREVSEENEDDIEKIAEAFDDMQTDSMGRGTVVYFPNVPFVSEEDEGFDMKEGESFNTAGD